MRRLMKATIATFGLIGAALLALPSAQAMPVAGGLAAATSNKLLEKVYLVCPRPRWNGFAWVQPPCYNAAPAVPLYAPGVLGPPVVVVRPRYRRRVIVY